MTFDLSSFAFTNAGDKVTRCEQLLVPSLSTVNSLQGSDFLSGEGEIGILVEESGILNTGLGEDVISGTGSGNSLLNPTTTLSGILNRGSISTGLGNDVIRGHYVVEAEPGIEIDTRASGLLNFTSGIIDTGAGDDQISGSVVDGNAGIQNLNIIDTGTGNDTLTGSSQGLGAGIVNSGTISTGEGDDRISADSEDQTSFGNAGLLTTGGGNDAITVTGGGLLNTTSRSFSGAIDTGTGDDQISAIGSNFGIQNLVDNTIDTGTGNDTITSSGGKFGILNNGLIRTGSGNDVVTGITTDVGESDPFVGLGGNGTIDLGDGNDTLIGFGVQTILGGSGFDTAVFDFASTELERVSLGSSSGIDIELTVTLPAPFGVDGTLSLGSVESLQFTDGSFTPTQLLT